MPRSKPASTDVAFFASDAGLLLERLVAAGVVKARDIASARRALADEVDQLERRIGELKAMSEGQGPKVSRRVVPGIRGAGKTGTARKRKRTRTDAELKEIKRLQGRFLGLMHKIPKAMLAKFKDQIVSKGKAVVVDQMEKYVREQGATKTKASSRRRRSRNRKD